MACWMTEIERLAGELRIVELLAGWPFRREGEATSPSRAAPQGRVERLAARMVSGELSWTEAMQKGIAYYEKSGNAEEAARIAINLAETYPRAASQSAEAARWLRELGREVEAAAYLERAIEIAPYREAYRDALAELAGTAAQRDEE